MKNLLFLLIASFSISSFAQNGSIILTEENLGNSFGDHVVILEDKEHVLTIEDVVKKPLSEFKLGDHPIPNLDFTTSRFWIKFSITNQTENQHFIVDVARPITNKVNFYQMRGEIVENFFQAGDDFKFDEKSIPHRKNLFPVYLEKGETKDFFVELESDGEVLTMLFKIYDKTTFFENDYFNQFAYGFYFGIVLLVVIIYFFFYVLLKDRSFLFYIIYVFWLGVLQFSLDGYHFQYIFSEGGYLTNHLLLLSASMTILFLLIFADSFLRLKESRPKMRKVFKYTFIFALVAMMCSFIPGITYEICYPLINFTSLFSVILVLVAIWRIKALGISVDNYFTMAFTVLICGAVVFILGNFNIVGNAEISQNALKISSALEVIILSISMSNKYRILQKEKEAAQADAYKSLEEKNEMMDQINVKLEIQVKERTAKIEHQNEQLAEINGEILSSIKYAKRIQQAILPAKEQVQKLLDDYLIFYRPKDVVSGDFYFIEGTNTTNEEQTPVVLFAAVDCTGHGVPGAFMSIVGNNYLSQTLTAPNVNTPAEALDFLNKGVVKALRQDMSQKSSASSIRDGMDISLCALDKSKNMLYFAGAKNPVYIVRKAKAENQDVFGKRDSDKNPLKWDDGNIYLYEIKGDKQPIGAYLDEELIPFTNHSFQLEKGDMVYVFTDGFADQFGGSSASKAKKYTYKRYKQFLLKISQLSSHEQHKLLRNEFTEWKGGVEQLDDVLVIGVRI